MDTEHRRQSRFRHILQELACHSPYTLLGAGAGIAFMLIFRHFGQEAGSTLFRIFHPAHVVLSAMVTGSLFYLHAKKRNFLTIFIVGYVGSIGIATLSDCVIPFFGEEILGVAVPSHAAQHGPAYDADAADGHIHGPECDHAEPDEAPASEHVHGPECHHSDDPAHGSIHDHSHGLHLGFIEEWYLINPAALLGILLAWKIPRTRLPHALHVLISTWASSAHMLMNTRAELTAVILFGMFIVLFIAVWLPCCVSDIIFPLLFVKGDIGKACRCSCTHQHDHDHDSDPDLTAAEPAC